MDESNGAKAELFSDTPLKGTILLADDEPAIRQVAARMLRKLGLKVLVAEDGKEALAAYEAYRDSLSCMLIDLTMPGLTGDKILDRVEEDNVNIPVILSSGFNQQDTMRRNPMQGVAGFLQKPYTMKRLQEVLQQALHKGH
jgi:CheY-like chemotaxis protein